MPELPEVETVRTGLAPVFENNKITDVRLARPDLRFAFPVNFAKRLTGASGTKLWRRAKYLLLELDTGETLLSHLGMSGSYLVLANKQAPPDGRKPKHDHVVFEMQDGSQIIYNDPRRFGFMDLFATDKLKDCKFLKHLGPEPTGNVLSASGLAPQLAKKKTPIKTALLDQRLIAGLGNIYVCEVLFRSHLHPAKCCCDLSLAQIETMVGHIRDVIFEAIAAGGSSLNDFSNAKGELGYFQHGFAVYDRMGLPCPTASCSGSIERMVQSGRSSFYCPKCQI
ncbi:Formamidopyrimidine-DNA glycosylase [hydrothermal vent metagenome]|uniref:Formamidopyrimidine-DNA glycosylase n=1 Tax=hydrothermal vent metagenome TaxID=652676 RepID=A0A3B0SSB4_9ZZZZ